MKIRQIFLVFFGAVTTMTGCARFEIEPPRPQFWNYPKVSEAQVKAEIRDDGKLYIELHHPFLKGVTPKMLSWWYRNLASGKATIENKEYTFYHLFHLSEHGQTRVIKPATDGSEGMGVGAVVYRQERFGRFLSKGQGRVLAFSENGFTVQPFMGLFTLGTIEHVFVERVHEKISGTDYTVKILLGSDAPLVGALLSYYIRTVQFSPEVVTEWVRHQVEEVGSLPHFLPKIYPIKNTPVSFKWLGTSNFVLSDGKTTIMFDPAMTRATLWDYLPFKKVSTNPSEVNYWLDRCHISKVDAVFVNHTHFDHVADASFVTKKFMSLLYGSSSVMNVGLGQGVTATQLKQIKGSDEIKVGDFKIKVFSTPHAPHFLDVTLMNGPIQTPLASETSVWDYRVGDTFSYFISHPRGTILFQAIGRIYENDALKGMKADILLMTIANRISTEHLIEKRMIPTHAKKIISLHHDNFFLPMQREGDLKLLWGVKLEEFKEKTKSFNIVYPHYCKEESLF